MAFVCISQVNSNSITLLTCENYTISSVRVTVIYHVNTEQYLYKRMFSQHAWFHTLQLWQLQVILTLFSKSFSTFPHGTYVLSISHTYLALQEAYLHICVSLQRNTTPQRSTVHRRLQEEQVFHLFCNSVSRDIPMHFYWILFVRLQLKTGALISKVSASRFIRH